MLFNRPDYFIFLGVALAAFWLLWRRRTLRLSVLFAFSCVFYMAWSPKYIVLILGSTILDYTVGGRIHAAASRGKKKAWLTLSLVGNLGLLGTFKYFNFFASASNDIASLFGAGFEPPLLDVMLPVGISFYTFQTLSYTIDIYRGRLEPAKNLLEFAVFVTYFPQLVAGPIVRAAEFLPQLKDRPQLHSGRVSEGVFLILTGLVKKVVVADYLSVNLVDRIFDNPELYSASEVVVGLYAFTMQIYCDFSGYTDVARGSASLMGFQLPENFDRPYQATNPAAFWRRWHMTLSTWLRDYLYFPLGGSKVSPVRAYFNLWLTLFLIGIWHGASWTFVVYGALQGTAMVLHRFVHRLSGRDRYEVDGWTMKAFKIFCNMQFVVFSRILFRATGIDNAWAVTERLFSQTSSLAQVSTGVWVILVGSLTAHYFPRSWYERPKALFVAMPAPIQGLAVAAVALTLGQVATSEVVPYIYFQF